MDSSTLRRKGEKSYIWQHIYRCGHHHWRWHARHAVGNFRRGFQRHLRYLVEPVAVDVLQRVITVVEVYQYRPSHTGLGALAKIYLGQWGQWLTGFSMLFLMYALTAAYISGAGELLASSLHQWSGYTLPSSAGILLFTLIAGSVVCIGTTSVDFFNRLLFSGKLLMLLVMLGMMIPHVEKQNLLTLPLQQGLTLSALPVVLTSFGFHGSIPSIVHYMGGHSRKLRRIFIIGSAIPLFVYLFWQLATLDALSGNTFTAILAQQAGLNGLMQAI